ncbi:MAG TPA: serine/threonine-protein kinase [Thermoanaerobaculia bacterium]
MTGAADDDATRAMPAGFAGPPREPRRPSTDRLPGTLVARRWRLVAPLGRGGMGEVWRADDLKLGQPVALKFLPPELARDPRRLDRLVAEVRLARLIAHPNVCRVYDLGEADGQHFLSMEYVDGEDLASLLRRIGRLPREKAVDVARQLCAGLAAAHEQGVLHRDLKPANVMIDGRGRVRIADFGLAAPLGGDGEGADRAAGHGGTPGYMAPEQLAGGPATVASDVYALGLVLYELFTGRRAFAGGRSGGETPSRPSSVLEALDPAVERAILRCLEVDPAERSRSVAAVAAALPGGDPLAAARAAGETPSPELVAAAGSGAVGGRRTAALLALVVAGLALAIPLAARIDPALRSPLPKPPEALRDRARELLAGLGHDLPRGDWVDGFLLDRGRLAATGADGAAADPSPLAYYYRESPRPLGRGQPWSPGGFDLPVHGEPGSVRMVLAPGGELRRYEVVPSEELVAGEGGTADGERQPDWRPLLAAAGLDPRSLAAAEPRWAPPVWADRRAAWTAADPTAPGDPIRVEAAARSGRPVWLVVRDPDHRSPELLPTKAGLAPRIGAALVPLWIALAISVAALFARRNLRLGRGDRRGALRFAAALGGLRFLALVLRSRWPDAGQALDMAFSALAWALLVALLGWIFYLASEPALRRLWPQMLVSWVRLLDGRWRDRLVAHDVLVGCAAGLAYLLIFRAAQLLPPLVGLEAVPPDRFGFGTGSLLALRGLRHQAAWTVELVPGALIDSFYGLVMLLLLRLTLRRTGPALAGLIVLYVAAFTGGGPPAVALALALHAAAMAFVLFRCGLLAYFVAAWVWRVLRAAPLTLDLDLWYADRGLLALALVLGLAVWAYSRARQPVPALQPAPA